MLPYVRRDLPNSLALPERLDAHVQFSSPSHPRRLVLGDRRARAWLFIEPNVVRAGAGRITLSVAGLDAFLERLAAQHIEHEPIERQVLVR